MLVAVEVHPEGAELPGVEAEEFSASSSGGTSRTNELAS